jgi:histidine triad (HIT) family protein
LKLLLVILFCISLENAEEVNKMTNCIFCKIVKGEIPSKKIYEDDKVLAFHDIAPEAPVHFLVIPKEHIESANMINEENSKIVAHIFTVINKIVRELNIADTGYRIVNNCGEQGGQTVHHVHFHVLGGRDLKWPPG